MRGKKNFNLVSMVAVSFCVVACASTTKTPPPNVTMTMEGAYQIIEFGSDKEKSILTARQNANAVCKKQKGGLAIIVNEQTSYQGVVGQEMGKIAQKAGDISKIFDKSKKASEGIETFSAEDYKTVLDFKCSNIR